MHLARPRPRPARLLAAAIASLVAAGLAATAAPSPSVATPSAAVTAKRPNIVLILMDDFSMDLVRNMPQAASMARSGASYSHSFVADSLCCVSRTSLFTGQYPHLTGVLTNTSNSSTAPVGGWAAYKAYGNIAKSFDTSLHAAGYTTGFMGKFMNQYDVSTAANGRVTAPEAPTGWSVFRPIYFGGYREWGWYYGYPTSHGLAVAKRPLTRSDKDYATNVLSDWAVRFINRHKTSTRPYFLEIAPYGPHQRSHGRAHPGDPMFPPAYLDRPHHLKRHGNCGPKRCQFMRAKNLPGYDDDRADNVPVYADGTSAAPWQDNNVRLDGATQDARWRDRARMVQSIDRMVARVRRTVGPNTYVFLTSDNGFHLGQYKLAMGKSTPYQSDVQVPLLVTGPGVRAGARQQVVENVDLASTFEQLAGLTPSDVRAGSSILPSLRNPAATGDQYAFFEHTYKRANPDQDPDYDTDSGGNSLLVPSYTAIRSKDALLVKWDLDKAWATTDYAYELYRYDDGTTYEKTNLYARDRDEPWVQDLQARLDAFPTCQPAQCRSLAAGDPLPTPAG